MNFYFFVQIVLLRVDSVVYPAELFPPQENIVALAPDSPIALLRVDSVVYPAELFPPQGNIVAPAPDSPVDEEPSWKAVPQVPLPYHVVNQVTSADTLELQYKTRSHLQQFFSGLGSTVFGRLLMNFYFFVQAVQRKRGDGISVLSGAYTWYRRDILERQFSITASSATTSGARFQFAF
ncbi:hypothetical protein MRX96_008590 [Rhipicephalus microplus]